MPSFDAVASATGFTTTTTSLTFAHTCGASATLLIVPVGLGAQGGSDAGITISVTYNGVAMTALTAQIHNNAGTSGFGQVFYLLAPTTGSAQNVVVTRTGGSGTIDLLGNAVSYNAAGAPLNVVTAASASTSAANTVTIGTGQMGGQFASTGNTVSGVSHTSRYTHNINALSAGGNAAYQDTATTGSVAMTVTLTSDWWSAIGFAIPASSSSAVLEVAAPWSARPPGNASPASRRPLSMRTEETVSSSTVGVGATDTAAATDTATTTASAAATDTASAVDAGALAAALSGTDTAAGTDTGSLAAAVTATDTAAGTDTAATAVSQAATDTGAGGDSASLSAGLTGSETATGADAASVVVSISATDTATAVDTASVDTGATAKSGTDTATASDSAAVSRTGSTADTAAAADAGSVTAALVAADTATAVDSAFVTVILTATDNASAADLASLAATTAAADLASALDSATVDTGIVIPTPIERTLTVPAEDRTLVVAREGRTLVARADDRTLTVPPENRTLEA